MAESHCPNCGTPWAADADTCPHCGFVRPAEPAWPPAPTGYSTAPPAMPPFAPPTPRLVTGKVWGDITLGTVLTLASFLVSGLGFILMPVLYFTLRSQYPTFMRGVVYSLLLGFALLLGAIGWCFYSLANGSGF